MDWVIIILVSVALLGGASYIGFRRRKKLQEEGVIIEREHDFFRQKHLYTLRPFDFPQFIETLHKFDWSKASSWGYSESKKLVIFGEEKIWQASFMQVQASENQVTYEFSFNSWQETNSTNTYANEMNATLTNVEKALVLTDPDTTVRSEYVKTKSKTKMF